MNAGEELSDPLLTCLEYLCGQFGHAKSAQSIKSGMAYGDSGMGAELFCEAAQKLGLQAKIARRSALHSISSALLPCVIFLKGDTPCVLLGISKGGKSAKIFLPQTQSVKDMPLSDLQGEYAGFVIFIHPTATFDKPESINESDPDHHWFWGLVRESRSTYTLVILASVFINLFGLVSPMFTMNVYDRVLPNNAIETGWMLAIGAFIAFAFDFIFRNLRGYLIDFAGRRTDVLAARRIYDQVLNMRLSERPASSGSFANMLRDFDAVREFFTSATMTALVDLPFALVFLFFVYRLAGDVAFILVGLIAVVIFAGWLIQMRLKHVVRKSVQSAESKHGLLVETIHGLETIKSGNADGRFRLRYGKVVAENALHAQKSRFWSALGVNIALFLQQVAAVIIVLHGMYLVQSGALTVGGLIACVILGGRAIAPIGQIANLMTRYHQAGGAMKSLDVFMSKPVERPRTRRFLHRPDLKGKMTFEKVSFAYPHTDNQVLDDVSFNIERGERVGIIGRIGSGKSTLARLMMNMYEPQGGRILVDDTDMRQIDPADLRRNMAYIAQDAVLFQGSVRENITASLPHANEEHVLAVAKDSGVHDFVSVHPMGYDAPVGEYGSFLSGGQRQAISLARAMLINPHVMICDEPTNAMDSQAEEAFCRYVREKMKDKTFILVTHRHSLLPLVDRLILLHRGRVIMDGKRDEVIAALQAGSVKVERE